MANNLKPRLWFILLANLIVFGLLFYGVYWIGVASGMPMAGLLIGGITFLVSVGIQVCALIRISRNPNWNPAAISTQIDSRTYSRLTSLAKMLVGSPLSLPVALMKGFKAWKSEESKFGKDTQ